MKCRKRVAAIVVVAALLAGIFPADNRAAAAGANTLVLDKKTCVMKKGTKLKLKATVSLDRLSGSIKWTSSDWSVASVNWKGEVTAKKKGNAVIKVTVGKQKASCKITVGTPVKKIKLAKKTITVTAGSSVKLDAQAAPKKATVKTLKYTVKNKKIATVSKKGVVRGIKAGTTWVTVSSKDGNDKTAKVKIKVRSKASNKTQPPVNVTVNPIINVIYPTSDPVAVPTTTPQPDDSKSTANPQPDDPEPTPYNKVDVTGIQLSDSEKSLNLNETAQLTASISPENATDQSVTWESSDTEVAIVSKDGLVTPKGEGTAEISASAADGRYVAKCTVTVTPIAIVSNNKEITEALSLKKLKTLIVKSDTEEKLTVPEGTYSDVEMEVCLPEGELENNAVFKSITISEIAEDTYIEKAIGNVIKVLSEKSHIVIDETADATIIVSEESKEAAIENNGSIQKLEICTSGKVDIAGTSDEKISVEIRAEVTISSTRRLDINASNYFDITIRPGAESTEITIDAEIHMPGIFGLGMISVKISATGEIKTVVSENNDVDELAESVLFTGTVRDVDGNGIEGAQITIVPYTSDTELQKDRAVTLTTNGDGTYSSSDKVMSGNYYFTVEKEGYMGVIEQVLVITSVYGDTYTNEEIVLIPADWEGKTGSVTGKILDSEQKDLALSDITVSIRNGKNAFSSDLDIVEKTKTDEEGMYLFENLEAGYYTIQLDDEKTSAEEDAYVRTWINVLIRPDETTTEGAIMSKKLTDGQLRFILSWGSKDSGAVADLDAHLRGPAGYEYGDYRFHTYFENKNFDNGYDERRSRADLDVDDIDYEGPETTTIYESTPGIYSYYVHNYTNRYEQESDKLAGSSVKVEVYSGNVKQNTYYIPQQEGTVWHVFDYDSSKNTFKTVNTMYYEQAYWYVGNTVDEYKENISFYMPYIEKYQNSLVEGTGEDITEKVAAYQKRMDALTDQQEAEAAELRYDVYRYYDYDLWYECSLGCSAEGITYRSLDWENGDITFSVNGQEYEPAINTFYGQDNASVMEVTPTKKDAWKAFQVTAENGHARVIHVYLEFDITVRDITIGEESMSWCSGNDYVNGEQRYPCIYVYTQQEKDFELGDLMFTFSDAAGEISLDSKKADGEYTITIEAGSQEKTWVVRKLSIPQITDSENQIYKTTLNGGCNYSYNYLYAYADNKQFNDDCIFKVNGIQYELTKGKSNPEYSYYTAYAQELGITYWIYCYPVDYACTLTDIWFNQNANVEINQSDHSVIVTVYDSSITAEDLSLSGWWNPTSNADTKAEYEAVTGEDYAGKITVTLDGVKDYTTEYKVYLKPYQESAE